MKEFKFIHAADLHLDVPMKNMPLFSEFTSYATFMALENLLSFALKEKPDAILLSGDVWNHEDLSLKARLLLKNVCEKLQKADIKVFLAHGNHDPLENSFSYVQLPENVHIFSRNAEKIPFYKNGELIAIIEGISHSRKKETDNLSAQFQIVTEKMKEKHFYISMLHTSLNKHDGEAIYAPCSIADLKEKNPHYWALGHVHSYNIIEENPFIAYSGALQGTHINEDEAHGCILVEMKRDDQSQAVEITHKFIPLAPLFWKKLTLELNQIENENTSSTEESNNYLNLLENTNNISNQFLLSDIPSLQSYLIEKMYDILEEVPEITKQVILQIKLTQQSHLNALLRNIYTINDLVESLNEQGQSMKPSVFVRDIIVDTKDIQEEKNIELLLQKDDFLSEVLQEAEKLMPDSTKDAYETSSLGELTTQDNSLYLAMQKLYHDSPLLKQHKKFIPLTSDEEKLKQIVRKAQDICAEILESDTN